MDFKLTINKGTIDEYSFQTNTGPKLNLLVLIPLIAMIGFALVPSYSAFTDRCTLVKL